MSYGQHIVKGVSYLSRKQEQTNWPYKLYMFKHMHIIEDMQQ